MSKSTTGYNHSVSDKKWQKKWLKNKINYPAKLIPKRNGFYNLWMFPYPSGEGLHAGHAFASTGSDIFGRFMRMQGKSVFQPFGYDSFGMHSENYALKIKEHPRDMLSRTIKNYEKQMKAMGHGYDWTRTVTTSDPDYYRWTQWMFVEMFKAGLAYRKEAKVNWCPSCKTVLADEQVMTPAMAGKKPRGLKKGQQASDALVCERCGHVVEERMLAQWMFRITDYADKLLSNLDKIDWTEKIKTSQRNWIGKKEGITIKYPIINDQLTNKQFSIKCWTSRPDTNFGATFVVIAPEHPIVEKITKKKYSSAVKKYIKSTKSKTQRDGLIEGGMKTGVFTGSYAVNQLTGKKMPVWISDFVLMDFGTGAVVGVPGHDKRDFEFAKKFRLEVIRVVTGSDGDKSKITRVEQVQENEGTMVNSGFLDGMDIFKATKKMMDYIEKKGWGKMTKTYHLRDWLISRQRYWGPPIPMIFCKNCARKKRGWIGSNKAKKWLEKSKFNTEFKKKIIGNWELGIDNSADWSAAGWYPEEKLPVVLPYLEDYQPKGGGRGPLADHPEFYEVVCPECGEKARRETDVSDTFFDSAWYFLRYPSVDAKSASKAAFDNKITKAWLPVDFYFGGAEHAVLHLMYSRFVTMVLSDLKYIDFEEPFTKFYAHGLLIKDGAKMSKSRGNIVIPDVYIKKFGADTLRLYLMFMGPMDGYPDFRDTGIEGMRRFVDRVWNLCNSFQVTNSSKVSKQQLVKVHQTIKKVTEDMGEFQYNTAIAAIMELVNALKDQAKVSKDSIETLILLLNPFAPHISEEIWVSVLGNNFSIQKAMWPKYDLKLMAEDKVTIPVQVNGKLRSTLKVNVSDSMKVKDVAKLAKEDLKVKKWLGGKKPKKEIFVPGKLINFVV